MPTRPRIPTRPRLAAGCIAAVAAATAILAPLPARADGCKLSTMTIPVRMSGSRPIVTLGINGTQVPLLLDTGAFFSMLTESAAKQLNLSTIPAKSLVIEGISGSALARVARVGKVKLQDAEIPNVEFLVGGNELDQGVMGLMGRNFLSIADNEFDFANGVLRMVVPRGNCDDANLAYWAGDTPVNEVPLSRSYIRRDTAIRVKPLVNDHAVSAMLDSGAGTLLGRRAAHRSGIQDEQMTAVGRAGGIGSGHSALWSAPVERFTLGGETIRNNVLSIVEDIGTQEDMLLGIDYFLSHRIYVARGQGKLYATWNGGPVFSHNKTDEDAARQEARYAKAPDAAPTSDADALARSGEASASRRKFAEALADLDRACALAPDNGAYLTARAKVQLALKNPQAALADIEQALKLDPSDTSARLLRAGLRAHRPDSHAEAIEDLAALDAALPHESHQRARMAELYNDLDRPAEAVHQWDLWLSSHEDDAGRGQVYNARCWMRARLNSELQLALQDCKHAVSEDGDNGSYRDSLGWVYLRLTQPRQAVDAFDRALALNPGAAGSLVGRGLAKTRLGDKAAGEADLAAARAKDPSIEGKLKTWGFDLGEPATPASAPQ